jgi:hypothetical protein
VEGEEDQDCSSSEEGLEGIYRYNIDI